MTDTMILKPADNIRSKSDLGCKNCHMVLGTVFVDAERGDFPYLHIEKLAIDLEGIDSQMSNNTWSSIYEDGLF